MSEQTTSLPDDLRSFLTEAGPDAYALAYGDTDTDPVPCGSAQAPAVGETGAVRSADGIARLSLQEVCRGQQETLRRWLQLDDGQRQLAISAADLGALRELTPGDLAADLLRDPASDEAQLTAWLGSWTYRRYAEAPQGLELGWIAAAAAWSCHMRALASHPPPSVLSPAMAAAGELDQATRELVTSSGLKLADLLDRMEQPYRPRAELVVVVTAAAATASGDPFPVRPQRGCHRQPSPSRRTSSAHISAPGLAAGRTVRRVPGG
ncbi:hypothetical protein FBY35_3734 [Streptomyces sp. SLBN-118]|uniref:hypothetical protein n=1 Tax=Streptomyces sp. SLBN-118 TaxID=2768454 RepID=UPI00114E54E6|nr:hypothetical protein [Streptomyces sp. SLBN-118]TQK42342.1 hypothetical protein FBY35_3734 [Streptomyces sp. SLBN-118]